VRGATTIDEDTTEQIDARVREMLGEVFAENDIDDDDLVSMIFTTTDDINAMFPATAARSMGLDDVPLLGATEMAVPGSTPLCIRVMVHFHTNRSRSEVRHVYLHGAAALRPDLS
jgi:chorismate mutase